MKAVGLLSRLACIAIEYDQRKLVPVHPGTPVLLPGLTLYQPCHLAEHFIATIAVEQFVGNAELVYVEDHQAVFGTPGAGVNNGLVKLYAKAIAIKQTGEIIPIGVSADSPLDMLKGIVEAAING